MPRELPPETKLLLAAEGALSQTGARRAEHLSDMRRLARTEPTPGAHPAFRLLRGAADAYGAMTERHPLSAEITRFLRAAIDIAHKAPKPDAWQPKYTGGALRHFEREDRS